MKCPYCGFENHDDTVTCEMCDMPMRQLARKRPAAGPSTQQPAKQEKPQRIERPMDRHESPSVGCPNCGSPLCDCAPIVKTTVKSSGGGYGFFSGCCGTIFLGPLGLLCGLRKQTITSTNQTWWACKKCGKEFVEKEAAKEIAQSIRVRCTTATGVIAVVWQIVFNLIGYSGWVRNIALLAIAGVWIALPEMVKEETGYAVKQLLVKEERSEFYRNCAVYGVIAFLAGAGISGTILRFLLS